MKQKRKDNKAFTLMELILVISLIGFLFAFSLPKFRVYKNRDTTAGVEAWLRLKTRNCRVVAISQNSFYAINFDLFAGSMWVTKEKKINDNDPDIKKENLLKLPDHINITEINIERETEKISDVYKVYFYPNGYSDKAVIHIENSKNQNNKTFVIEPFLTKLITYNEYITFGF